MQTIPGYWNQIEKEKEYIQYYTGTTSYILINSKLNKAHNIY